MTKGKKKTTLFFGLFFFNFKTVLITDTKVGAEEKRKL